MNEINKDSEKTTYGKVSSLADERLKFMPKDERKRQRKELKQRNQTVVKHSGLFAVESRSRNSLIIHIEKKQIPESGLHLSMRIEDIEAFMEDGVREIPIYQVVRVGDENAENQTPTAN